MKSLGGLLTFAIFAQLSMGVSSHAEVFVSNGETYRVTLLSPIGRITAPAVLPLTFTVTLNNGEPLSPDDLTITVDAAMIAHYHGLVRSPIVRRLRGTTFTVDGLFFHMPGEWDIFVDVKRGRILERTQWEIDVQ